ncbi:MAG: DUF4430 domain-containing protein [Oscillospiraceae bacterium]|jgi:predicted small lipoprotein YifL|nr:DUF4430 domain-containing protein [Oscillospiraceae bacterium]
MKHKNAVHITAVLAIVLLFSCAACGTNGTETIPASTTITGGTDAPQPVGEGALRFSFTVTDKDGLITAYLVNTDEKTVGAALIEAGLIDGEQQAFGLMVKSVNGLRADYELDKAYWAFFIDGEYASTGVDVTDIQAGKVYSFVYTLDA